MKKDRGLYWVFGSVAVVVAIAVLIGVLVPQQKTTSNTGEKKPVYLFSQTAKSTTVDKQGDQYIVTLHDVSPLTLYFSEAPFKIVDTLDTKAFIENWSTTFFKDMDPNAALAYISGDGQKGGLEVGTITKATWSPDGSVTYLAKPMSVSRSERLAMAGQPIAQLPATTGTSVVVIDAVEMPQAGEVFTTCLFPNDTGKSNNLKTWNPETDETVKYYADISKVQPRLSRSDVFSSTIPRVMGLMDVAAMKQLGKTPCYDDSLFEGWNFIDIYVHFAGSAGEGLITAPTPGEIAIAHKNGIPVLSTLFFPPNDCGGNTSWEQQLIQKENGQFWAVDKLCQFAQTFGFDGWFFNTETSGLNSDDVAAYKELMKQLKDRGLIVGWYDSLANDGKIKYVNGLDSTNIDFLADSSGYFANYWWDDDKLETSRQTAGERAADVCMGVEWNNYASSGIGKVDELYKNNMNASEIVNEGQKLSLGLYAIERPLNNSNKTTAEQAHNSFVKVWWPTQFPNNPDGQLGDLGSFITPKTAITTYPFETNFNLGKGDRYFQSGAVTSEPPWGNLIEQDFLPQYLINNDHIKVDFDFNDAWQGGTSLRIENVSNQDYAGDVPIYLTAIEPPDSLQEARVMYKNNGSKTQHLYLKFADGERVQIKLAHTNGEWKEAVSSLKANSTLTEIGVSNIAASSSFNVGRIKY